MNEQEVIGYSVYVGIDWADKKHDICICPKETLKSESWEAANGTHRTVVQRSVFLILAGCKMISR